MREYNVKDKVFIKRKSDGAIFYGTISNKTITINLISTTTNYVVNIKEGVVCGGADNISKDINDLI